MGKGDKKTRRGKIIQGSYGKTRPRLKKNAWNPEAVAGDKSAKASELKPEVVEEKTPAAEVVIQEKPEAEEKTVKKPRKKKAEVEENAPAEEKAE
jgi:30S ribosomal protein S31